jgi:hypothetical protein
MKSMSIEQILQLAFQQAVFDAPPTPSAEWFRQRSAEHSPVKESSGSLWLQFREQFSSALELLIGERPIPWIHQEVEASTKDIVVKQHKRLLGTIPARVLRGDKIGKAAVEITQRPRVGKDGRLVLRVRVTGADFKDGESVEIVMLALPGGDPYIPPSLLTAGKKELLIIDLSPELQRDWHDVNWWEWSELPFRFLLRPRGMRGAAEGEASGLYLYASRSQRRRLSYVFDSIEPITSVVLSILGFYRERNGERQSHIESSGQHNR